MSTQSVQNSNTASLGELITHNEELWWVVRIVESSTWFEDEQESYLLEEKYAELRNCTSKEVGFKYFLQVKHPFPKSPENNIQRGLDPRIWRKF